MRLVDLPRRAHRASAQPRSRRASRSGGASRLPGQHAKDDAAWSRMVADPISGHGIEVTRAGRRRAAPVNPLNGVEFTSVVGLRVSEPTAA